MTTLGALLIFFFSKPSKSLNIVTIGLSAGIMFSASIWSLLVPAFESAEPKWKNLSFLPVSIGFALGGFFMITLNYFCSHLFKKNEEIRRPFKFFIAMTIHNIPEGLAVGFAVGTAVATKSAYLSAFMFTLGIALQNFPEGLATALPLQKFLQNRKKSFLLAFLSGVVEPIFAIIGYFLAVELTFLLPWLLSFSAGAMIFVIIEELMPELHETKNSFGSILFICGFIVMMILDVCL